MPEIEVHVDHEQGVIAVAWPTVPGWCIYEQGRCGGGPIEVRHTLPAGMTRMVAQPSDVPATSSGVVPRRREPRRYHPIAEGA